LGLFKKDEKLIRNLLLRLLVLMKFESVLLPLLMNIYLEICCCCSLVSSFQYGEFVVVHSLILHKIRRKKKTAAAPYEKRATKISKQTQPTVD